MRPVWTGVPTTICKEWWPTYRQRSYAYAEPRVARGPSAADRVAHLSRRCHPSVPTAFLTRHGAFVVGLVTASRSVNIRRGKSFALLLPKGGYGYVPDAGSNLLPLAAYCDAGRAGTHRLRFFAQRRQKWETRRYGRYRRRSAFARLWQGRRPGGFSPQR